MIPYTKRRLAEIIQREITSLHGQLRLLSMHGNKQARELSERIDGLQGVYRVLIKLPDDFVHGAQHDQAPGP